MSPLAFARSKPPRTASVQLGWSKRNPLPPDWPCAGTATVRPKAPARAHSRPTARRVRNRCVFIGILVADGTCPVGSLQAAGVKVLSAYNIRRTGFHERVRAYATGRWTAENPGRGVRV